MSRSVRLYRYRLPLVSPIRLGAALIREREGLLLAIDRAGEHLKYAEIAPLPGFSSETVDEAASELQTLLSDESAGYEQMASLANYPSVAWGISQLALQNAPAHAPVATRSIRVNGLLSGEPRACLERAQTLVSEGYTALKLKVGRGSIVSDSQLVRTLRELIGPAIELRLDANRAWSFADAAQFASLIQGCEIAYIEEPLADPGGLSLLHQQTSLPLALDESLRDLPMRHLAAIHGVRSVIVRPMLFGSIAKIAAVIDLAGELDAAPVFSSAFESSIGVAAVARLALESNANPAAAGFDTLSWLADDLCTPALQISAGQLDLSQFEASSIRLHQSMLRELSL